MHKALSLSLALIALAGCKKDPGTDTGTGGALPPDAASLTVALRAAPGAAVDLVLSDVSVVRPGGAEDVIEAGPIAVHLPADGAAVTLLDVDVDVDAGEIEAIVFEAGADRVYVPLAAPLVLDGAAEVAITVDAAGASFRAE